MEGVKKLKSEHKIKRMQHGSSALWKGYKIKKLHHEKQANT